MGTLNFILVRQATQASNSPLILSDNINLPTQVTPVPLKTHKMVGMNDYQAGPSSAEAAPQSAGVPAEEEVASGVMKPEPKCSLDQPLIE